MTTIVNSVFSRKLIIYTVTANFEANHSVAVTID